MNGLTPYDPYQFIQPCALIKLPWYLNQRYTELVVPKNVSREDQPVLLYIQDYIERMIIEEISSEPPLYMLRYCHKSLISLDTMCNLFTTQQVFAISHCLSNVQERTFIGSAKQLVLKANVDNPLFEGHSIFLLYHVLEPLDKLPLSYEELMNFWMSRVIQSIISFLQTNENPAHLVIFIDASCSRDFWKTYDMSLIIHLVCQLTSIVIGSLSLKLNNDRSGFTSFQIVILQCCSFNESVNRLRTHTNVLKNQDFSPPSNELPKEPEKKKLSCFRNNIITNLFCQQRADETKLSVVAPTIQQKSSETIKYCSADTNLSNRVKYIGLPQKEAQINIGSTLTRAIDLQPSVHKPMDCLHPNSVCNCTKCSARIDLYRLSPSVCSPERLSSQFASASPNPYYSSMKSTNVNCRYNNNTMDTNCFYNINANKLHECNTNDYTNLTVPIIPQENFSKPTVSHISTSSVRINSVLPQETYRETVEEPLNHKTHHQDNTRRSNMDTSKIMCENRKISDKSLGEWKAHDFSNHLFKSVVCSPSTSKISKSNIPGLEANESNLNQPNLQKVFCRKDLQPVDSTKFNKVEQEANIVSNLDSTDSSKYNYKTLLKQTNNDSPLNRYTLDRLNWPKQTVGTQYEESSLSNNNTRTSSGKIAFIDRSKPNAKETEAHVCSNNDQRVADSSNIIYYKSSGACNPPEVRKIFDTCDDSKLLKVVYVQRKNPDLPGFATFKT